MLGAKPWLERGQEGAGREELEEKVQAGAGAIPPAWVAFPFAHSAQSTLPIRTRLHSGLLDRHFDPLVAPQVYFMMQALPCSQDKRWTLPPSSRQVGCLGQASFPP